MHLTHSPPSKSWPPVLLALLLLSSSLTAPLVLLLGVDPVRQYGSMVMTTGSGAGPWV